MNTELLEMEEPMAESGCSDWQPHQRGVRPVGFPYPHSLKGWSTAPAVPAQEVARLTAEVAQMRAQFARALSEIEQKLSPGRAPRLPLRKTRLNRKGAEQNVLPLIPAELAQIADAIENSKIIFNRQPDPSDDLALLCSQATWRRAAKLLISHALSIWEKARVTIRPPAISAGPGGSVDLYWTAAPYGLLLNVPADPQQPATYYGDDAANPDSNRTCGKLAPAKPIDIGVLMWLAHTADQ